jgi:hypothetical protein
MPSGETIPSDVQRFVLTSIRSIPHLEAILLLRRDPGAGWDAARMARSLYMAESCAGDLLAELADSGFASVDGESGLHRYAPAGEELKKMIEWVAKQYPTHIIEITRLIHSRIGTQAQQFGDAFKLNPDKKE